MPDMSKPGSHFEDLYNTLKFRADDCRDKARKLDTQADVYAEAASNLQRAMDKEEALAKQVSASAESTK